MTNSYRDYKSNFIDNLPSGVTYDSTLGRFYFNGKRFYTPQSVIWYRDYILKYDPDAVGFDPATLFASGEKGAWYEPSTTTAFASTTDPTPCAVGDTCGLLLDKSQGAGYSGGSFTGLGAEVVTNGGFDTDTDWTKGGTWTIASGVASAGGTSGALTQAVSLSATSFYVVTYTVTALTSGNLKVQFQGGSAVIGALRFFPGTYTELLIGGAGNTTLAFVAGGTTPDATIDNVTVKELPGNHATQATLASRPILRQTGGGVFYLEDDEVDDTLNWTAPADTDYTVSYVNTSGAVTTLTSQSLSGSTDILLDPALVGYVAVDRALTAGETTDLEAYLGGLV